MFDKIFLFNSMITPKLITFIYWMMLAGTAVTSIGFSMSGNILYGILILVSGFLFSRVWCELMIVLFKINENIQRIADRGQKSDTDLLA